MKELEISQVFNAMIAKTKMVSRETKLYYVLKGLLIDKK